MEAFEEGNRCCEASLTMQKSAEAIVVTVTKGRTSVKRWKGGFRLQAKKKINAERLNTAVWL